MLEEITCGHYWIIVQVCNTRSWLCEEKHAADAFGKVKCSKVASKITNTNYVFIPLIAETFGSWTDSAVKQINKLTSYYASHQKIPLPDAKNRIWTKIAILLQGESLCHSINVP
jgi:hypothetical protein